MRTAAILLLCILGAALFCTVSCNNSNGPDNCCFKFFPGTLSASRVRSFTLTDDRCPKPGVIFSLETKKKINICVKQNAAWVQEILQMLVGPARPPASAHTS
ncbi:C-C motif chemokine 13-like [Oryzias latipes]|uniref:Chemokine interleukin-8-like domain-containing protein n=1 Tax=Oryzias latipes TaxID=8090 RepID=A0A3B3HJF2_ORYLA|nr:C-C motif chemokine 13-like [Oryzias latipes]